MLNFEYSQPTKIVFGKDTHLKVGELAAKYGKKVLLHYGGGSVKKSGLYDMVTDSLKQNGVEFAELGGAVPNPRLALVRQGIELCRKENVDFILAVGGGSAIDSAKAIAMGVPYDGDVWDFFEGKTAEKALGVGVVLTIPAAGSESSCNSVITNEDGLLKRGATSQAMIPKFAILNPELTFTLPLYQMGCGISDIFAHLMERYFTNEKDNDYSDRLIEATMRTLICNADKAVNCTNDYNARSQVMWAGTIAHNGLLDRGRLGDWASHGIEHELSAIYDIAHGAGLSIVFPAWMKFVYTHDIGRFAQFAVRVFDADVAYTDLENVAVEGIRRIEKFYKSIGMPTRLTDVGIGSENFALMAKKCAGDGTRGNFVPLTAKDIETIYSMAM